jgi:hypothetical protein
MALLVLTVSPAWIQTLGTTPSPDAAGYSTTSTPHATATARFQQLKSVSSWWANVTYDALVPWRLDLWPLLRHLVTQPRPLILCRPRLLVLINWHSHHLHRQHLSHHSAAQFPFQHSFRYCVVLVRLYLPVCSHCRVSPHVTRQLALNQVLLRLTLRHLVTHLGMLLNRISFATRCGLLKLLR